MKKVILLGLLFVGLSCFAQGTTQKEYNYASKGYSDDLVMGKDIISGYSVDVLSNANTKVQEGGKPIDRITTIYKLTRTVDKSAAAFIIREKRVDNGNVVYNCLPNASADAVIWNLAQDQYFKKFKALKCDMDGQAYAYNWNVLKILSISLSN